MRSRRIVYRMVCTMAVASAPWVQGVSGPVYGFGLDGRSEAGRIQLVQHSPSPGGQATSNGAVSAELKKLFAESGQPMPSMNPRDLPNAQVQSSNAIRPVQRPGGQVSGSPAAGGAGARAGSAVQPQKGHSTSGQVAKSGPQSSAKKGFLQRFMGKVTGQEKKAAEAAVVPPVPPDFREPAPAPPSGGPIAAYPPGRGPSVQNSPGLRQGASSAATGNSVPGKAIVGSQAGAIRSVSDGQTRAPSGGSVSQNGAASGVPVRTAVAGQGGGQVRAASQPTQPVPDVPQTAVTSVSKTRLAPAENVSSGIKYVQPGTAPGFMPSNQVKAMAESKPSTAGIEVETTIKVQEEAPADSFELPFVEQDSADGSESLDLESLVTAVPESTGTVAADEVNDKSAMSVAERGGNEIASVVPSSEDSESPENPFTGVTLTMPETTLSTPDEGAASLPDEFESGLPLISLPSVEDLDDAASEVALDRSEPDFPELDFHNDSESLELVPTPNQNSEEAEFAQPDLPVGKRSADAEHLQQVAEQERRIRQQRMIQARADQTGFKGFCPVELRDRRELTETKPEYSATFGLQTYTFSSAAAKAAFESDPSRYAPAAGGNDVVLLVNSGEEQAGMLDYALWYRDRLYLFRSRETMAMFNKDPLRFANQY